MGKNPVSRTLQRFAAWCVLVLAFVAFLAALAVATSRLFPRTPIPVADPGPVQTPTALRVQPRLLET